MDWKEILSRIPSIRRPISLAALIVVVLWGIYKLILELPVFEDIGSERTFQLLDKLALYLFIIAFVAVVLSISKPILMTRMEPRSKDDATTQKDHPEQANSDIKEDTTVVKDVTKVEEYIFLLDEIVIEIKDMEYVGNTFGTMRRKLHLAGKLTKKASGHLLKVTAEHKNIKSDELSYFVTQLLPEFISEADYVLPYPAEDKYTRDRERLKDLKYRVITGWEIIKEHMLKDAEIKSRFEELKSDENRTWPIIGFENADAYFEYMTPSFPTLCKNATTMQKKLLSVLQESAKTSEEELISQGFPKEVVVETINALLISKMVKTEDYKIFTVTPVGKDLIADYLNQTTT